MSNHRPHSEETKRKIGAANAIALLGRKVPPEVIAKRLNTRRIKKEQGFYQKSIKHCIDCGTVVSYYAKRCVEHAAKVEKTPEYREKIRLTSLGRASTRKGTKLSIETRRKMSEVHKGEKSYRWKGGKSSENMKIRQSLDYRLWREGVFERDDYTCQICGVRGGKIQADHIKPFAYYPELRLELSNGRTLCVPCHRGTDTWGTRADKYAQIKNDELQTSRFGQI